ncbi:probable glucan endo-1,3-beta-glucosidase BG4 [Coffea arabica]|uniref:Probable glucan endo-1,3-beta-glucosidase BG4 n=1 Tax=Coffea arabica TaxID=13443 RepID=A0A6P6S631_COFAR|nr:probable glucan endo-1,3-beta-glucosidase BG4 [Coffea arabica]
MASLSFFQIVWIMVLVNFPTGTIGDKVNIGVSYPRFPPDVPSLPQEIIDLYKKYGIGKIRIPPIPDVLEALRGSDIDVALGIPNEDVETMATNFDFATFWYTQFIEPYVHDVKFTFMIVGNEAIPGERGSFVSPAMRNLQTVLDNNGLGSSIHVTTAVSTNVLDFTIPPSAAEFTIEALNEGLDKVVEFLQYVASNVLMVNVYPYYDYAADPANIRLDFAQFTANEAVIVDDTLNYTNLFDATLDAFFWALERANGSDVRLAVAETGWPTAGNGNVTTTALASTYNNNLVKHVVNYNGTPKKPGQGGLDAFIFSLFDENTDPDMGRRNFGIFNSNLEPAYPLFSANGNKHF